MNDEKIKQRIDLLTKPLPELILDGMRLLFFVLMIWNCASFAIDETQFAKSTFASAIKMHGVGNDAQPKSFAESTVTPGFSISVTYTGNSRDLSSGIKFFFSVPSQSIQSRKEFFSNYTKEIEVVESEEHYWIPVQKQVFPFIAKEIKRDQDFKIFVRYYGTLVGSTTKETRPVFLMMDFEKP